MSLSFLIAISSEDKALRMGRILEELGHRALATPDAAATAAALGQGPVDACLLDAELPERLSLARALVDHGLVVILVGSRPLQDVEPELADHLASDVLDPAAGVEDLRDMLKRVSHLRQVLSEREELRAAVLAPLDDLLEGPARATQRLKGEVERIASTPRTTVLIQGEPGTRKGLLARGIHGLSVRRRAPLRTLNPLASQRARFTGLLADLLAAAAGGTLVLSEVSGLELSHQKTLAQVLAEPPVDVRFVATTSIDLEERAGRGRFSEDLLYRLNVLTLRVPSLRDRTEDIPSLAQELVARHTPAGLPGAGLSPQAVEALVRHRWPGNLRELEATLIRATHLAQGQTIHPGHLGFSSGPARRPAEEGNPASNGSSAALELGDRSLRSVEEALIRLVLADERGNRSRTSRVLGINRSTLYNKLRLYGIE